MRANLATQHADPSRGFYFVGTTPPSADDAETEMQMIADKLLEH
jgi:hypothetical protein